MAIVIKPPAHLPDGYSVFLAGSIELGQAASWQTIIEDKLLLTEIIIFNPRRDSWSPEITQSKSDSQFREQVQWELSALEKANLIVMYFDPATKSPISLLELGLYAKSGKLIVCCPEGFWRKGNVDIVCDKYSIEQVVSLNELVERVIRIAHESRKA
jgi:hypothetical protein